MISNLVPDFLPWSFTFAVKIRVGCHGDRTRNKNYHPCLHRVSAPRFLCLFASSMFGSLLIPFRRRLSANFCQQRYVLARQVSQDNLPKLNGRCQIQCLCPESPLRLHYFYCTNSFGGRQYGLVSDGHLRLSPFARRGQAKVYTSAPTTGKMPDIISNFVQKSRFSAAELSQFSDSAFLQDYKYFFFND